LNVSAFPDSFFRLFVHARQQTRAPKGDKLKRLPPATPVRATIAIALGLAASLVLVPTFASGASSTNTVFMKDGKGGGLRFEGPETIVAGEELTVLNQTNPHKVGPHTFSLVTQGLIPKTPKARQLCFTPKHICKAIAAWHGVKGNGPVKVNPVDAGAEGWDTTGSLTKTGDSWFTGEKPGTSIVEKVTAEAGTTLHFLCAVHPWMHGSIEVVPPAGS
jgi:hypothetical protein